MSCELYQHCSQAVFEAWLNPRIQAEPLIHSIFEHFQWWEWRNWKEAGNEVLTSQTEDGSKIRAQIARHL